jgi:FAD:protein FMN transferase
MDAHITRRMRPLFGTYVEVGAAGENVAAVESAFDVMQGLQRELSFQDPHSALSVLNNSAGGWVRFSPLSMRVLRLARTMMLASHSLFDCTVGAELVRRGALPDHLSTHRRGSGNARDIELRGNAARLRAPVQITVDGIAKGYAVDSAIASLERHGIEAGWVNAGGDLRVFGELTLPVSRRDADGNLRQLGGLREAAIATSAVGEQSDPRFPGAIVSTTGQVAHGGVWTVVARRAWRADALTKVAALAPAKDRLDTVRRLGGRLIH